MEKGRIKFYNSKKGYGFIITEDNDEIFFHVSDFLDKVDDNRILEDVNVSFEKGFGRSGDKAIKIQILEDK